MSRMRSLYFVCGQALMGKLAATGVKEVQLHEPALVMWDSSKTLAAMFRTAYSADKVSDKRCRIALG